MFLLTRDELDAGCTASGRDDPGLVAPPYDDAAEYDARAGSRKAIDGRPAAPIDVAEAIKDVFDPEIPTNVYDLGLIYDISVDAAGDVSILATLTSPNCPVAGTLPGEIAEAAAGLPNVGRVGVSLDFTVPWSREMMSEIARVELGIFS